MIKNCVIRLLPSSSSSGAPLIAAAAASRAIKQPGAVALLGLRLFSSETSNYISSYSPEKIMKIEAMDHKLRYNHMDLEKVSGFVSLFIINVNFQVHIHVFFVCLILPNSNL